MILGITIYSALLWVIGWRIPGRLKKNYIRENNSIRNIWAVLLFNVLLSFLIILTLILIRYLVRGGL